MARRAIAIAAVLTVLLIATVTPTSVHAKRCGPVFAGQWAAERLNVQRITCGSAQAKLRRWFLRDRQPVLPRNSRRGWHCVRGFQGRNATPNTRGCINRVRPGPPLADFQTRPYFTFELIRIGEG